MPPPLKLLITLLSPVVVPLLAETVMMAIQAAAALVASKLLPARLLPFKPMLLPLVRAAPARLMDQILSLLQQHQQAAVEALKEFAEGRHMGDLDIRQMVDEGRRY